jgi:hypothetical protein
MVNMITAMPFRMFFTAFSFHVEPPPKPGKNCFLGWRPG